MQPGRYYKDGCLKTFIEVRRTDNVYVYGEQWWSPYMCERGLRYSGAKRIDDNEKLWVIELHEWQLFSSLENYDQERIN